MTAACGKRFGPAWFLFISTSQTLKRKSTHPRIFMVNPFVTFSLLVCVCIFIRMFESQSYPEKTLLLFDCVQLKHVRIGDTAHKNSKVQSKNNGVFL